MFSQFNMYIMKIKNKNKTKNLMLSMSPFISDTFGSFKNSFQKHSTSSYFKEAINVFFSLILEGRLLYMGMACAVKESVKNLLFFLISNVIFFELSCCFIPMVERGLILYTGRSLLSVRKK